jgi:superfamily II DNA helicase RecQ
MHAYVQGVSVDDDYPWFAGTVRVLCCTIAFGLGMDLPNIGLIIHWDAATSLLDYVQQTGRGGRNGSPCLCITLYDRAENSKRLRFFRKTPDATRRDYAVANMLQVCACVHLFAARAFRLRLMYARSMYASDSQDFCICCRRLRGTRVQTCVGISSLSDNFPSQRLTKNRVLLAKQDVTCVNRAGI